MSPQDEIFNEDRRDALQEIVNIAMGQAGSSLATVLGKFVELSIPKFYLSDVSKEEGFAADSQTPDKQVIVVKQPFAGELRGEALVLISSQDDLTMADLMGYDESLTAEQEEELLLDVSNILSGACLNGLVEQLGLKISFSAPSILGLDISEAELLAEYIRDWHYALIMEVNFTLEECTFSSNLLFFMTEDSFPPLMKSIDELLASF